MLKRMFATMFCVAMASLKVVDAGGGPVDGTSIAHTGEDVFGKDTGAGVNQAGSSDPIAPFAPDIAGGGNPASGSSGGKPEINGNYTFGAHKITPGGSMSGSD